MKNTDLKQKLLSYTLIIVIVLIAFFIRDQGTQHLSSGLLRGSDSYNHYKLAEIIVESGQLPSRDMSCWLPIGRDLTQTLNLYAYALAYIYKAITFFFPKVTLYHVTLYAPPLCFCIALGSLCLFIYRHYGILFTCGVGILVATLPGTIERSTAGFSDRDAWCLMLGILAIITYLTSLQTQQAYKRILWTCASGMLIFMGGLSWEGYGIFPCILLIVETWRFLTTEEENGLGYYLLWILTFGPFLWIVSPAYQNGSGYATHLTAFVLAPPIVLGVARALRHVFLVKTTTLRPYARTLALGFTVTVTAIALGYILIQRETFAETTVPFSQKNYMQSITELSDADFTFWISRYGSVFIIGCFGLLIIKYQWIQRYRSMLTIPTFLFMITLLFRKNIDNLIGIAHGTHLFYAVCGLCVLTFLFTAWTRKVSVENEETNVAIIAWFFIWAFLTRDAIRYDFFIGISLAFFTTKTIIYVVDNISKYIKWKQETLKTAGTAFIFAAILFFPPLGGHATRTTAAATINNVFPTDTLTTNTLIWMKHNLERNNIVAANWSYGSTLNVIANVKTIIDQDHYIPHWIHLYDRYIHRAKNEREILEFLKAHQATHILLTRRDPSDTFLRGHLSDAFLPVYPKNIFKDANIKLWEIKYPPNIKTNPKYLATAP